jgi:hypothetical protein
MQKLKKLLTNSALAAFMGLTFATGGVALLSQPVAALDCAILDCKSKDNPNGKIDADSDTAIFDILKWVLAIMTGLVGVAAVGWVIWAGILYTSAGDKADQVKKAKTIIIDVIIGIIAYGLMFIALNWIVPGGIIG